MNPSKTEVIKKFLELNTRPELASLYNFNMECQCMVAQDNGERITGEYKGKIWHGYTDGLTTWKPFRIPYNSAFEPTYEDTPMPFDSERIEAIGMTGWDWKNRVSRWVAFDFDAITGHSEKHSRKVTDAEIKQIIDTVSNVPWVTVRRSTSGHGLHLYIHLVPVPTQNHNEHAALARAILSKLSAFTGFDFLAKVDISGGNMWVWHRKMRGTNGLELVKQGTFLNEIPDNWKDHIAVVSGTRRRTVPKAVSDDDKLFEEVTGQTVHVALDEDHKKLFKYLEEHHCNWWWDSERHMLVTHTVHLKDAYTDLEYKGTFDTLAKGTEKGHDHNCFAFPLKNGAWAVRRFSPGCMESPTWTQDAQGWTRCFLNRLPDLRVAALSKKGVEHPGGGFVFEYVPDAVEAVKELGIKIDLPVWTNNKRAKLKEHKDGRLIVSLEHDPQKDKASEMIGWLPEKNNWTRIFNMPFQPSEPDLGNFDDVVRHLVTEHGDNYGWLLKSDGKWQTEPIEHLKVALASLGYAPKDIQQILGSSVMKCWTLVNQPFQEEYPGNRQWNLDSPQLRFQPSLAETLNYPTWKKILKHCGTSLDYAVENDNWCKSNLVLTGEDYLKIWVASLFQFPSQPLPYLFFYGPQNSGKSIFHEALNLLVTKGYVRGDTALKNSSNFNGELEHAILCIIEETDLPKNAYSKLKDWVTSPILPIHVKGKTPYNIPNTTHWVQTANEIRACPIFTGDTRITVIYVPELEPTQLIPKKEFFNLLEKEASDFLGEIMKLDLPNSYDRLNVPVLDTLEKKEIQFINRTVLEQFLEEKTFWAPGERIKYSTLWEQFQMYVSTGDAEYWTQRRMGRELPKKYPKGRCTVDGQWYIGNISLTKPETEKPLLKIVFSNTKEPMLV